MQYCTRLSEYWLQLLNDFSLSLQDEAGDNKNQAFIRKAAARFLYGMQISGIHDISQITFSVLEEYCDRDQHRSHNSDARYTYIIGDFLHAMAKRELCPYGLGWYPYFRMTDHILLFSDLSAEQQDRVEAFALRVLNSRQMNMHALYQVFWKNSSHSDIVNPL